MTLSLALDIASWMAFAGGSFFLFTGVFGLIRLPDFWSRLHAAGIVDTLAAELFILGMIFQAGFSIVTVKLILIGAFLFITGPTGTHAVANAAYVAGHRPLNFRDATGTKEPGTERKN